MRNAETIWYFETVNFRIEFNAAPEDDLDLSWDDTGEVREKLESGFFCAFVAEIRVTHKPTGAELATDYLGQCIYENPSEFMDHRAVGKQNREYAAQGEIRRCGSYFRDMISQAVKEARAHAATLQQIKLRAA